MTPSYMNCSMDPLDRFRKHATGTWKGRPFRLGKKPRYNCRARARFTVGFMLVPQSLAFAMLAGLPVQAAARSRRTGK